MSPVEQTLIDLLRSSLGETAPTDPGFDGPQWQKLLRLANWHKLLPLVLDAACGLPSYRKSVAKLEDFPEGASDRSGRQWTSVALQQVNQQVAQENELLNAILALRERGLEPLVMKGPICRSLYPKPLLRPSVDDDLLIPKDRGAAYHQAMLDLGLTPDDSKADPEGDYELSYHNLKGALYVELHKCLFNPKDPAFQGFNQLFEGAQERAVPVKLQDVDCRTLCPRDHLLFLILHAYKHFIHSGFGIRIVADICLFTRAHRETLDMEEIQAVCRSLRCDRFLTAVYQIGEKYLAIPAPECYRTRREDLEPLLADVMESGIHGQDLDRLHSAPITLRTVGQRGHGKSGGSLRATLFPSADRLKKTYPFLEKHPVLLPLAWGKRFAAYLTDRRGSGTVSPSATLRIAKERIQLLGHYGILDEESPDAPGKTP